MMSPEHEDDEKWAEDDPQTLRENYIRLAKLIAALSIECPDLSRPVMAVLTSKDEAIGEAAIEESRQVVRRLVLSAHMAERPLDENSLLQ